MYMGSAPQMMEREPSFMLNICSRERVGDSNTAESVLVTIQCYTRVLNCIKDTLQEGAVPSLAVLNRDEELVETVHIVECILRDLEEVQDRWVLIEAGVGTTSAYGYQAVRL